MTKIPFVTGIFGKAPFPCKKYHFLPCFEASWPFWWTIYQFHAHLLWDFCQKSHRQSYFVKFSALCANFPIHSNIFSQFSVSLVQKCKRNSGALILGMAQTPLEHLLLPVFLYCLTAKVFFRAENSFIYCFIALLWDWNLPFPKNILALLPFSENTKCPAPAWTRHFNH